MKRGEFAGYYFKEYENTDVTVEFVESHTGDEFPNAEPFSCEICGLSDGRVVYADDNVNCFVEDYRPGLDLCWNGEDWYYVDGTAVSPLKYGEEVA